MSRTERRKRGWKEKLRTKYRLVFITDDTLEERLTFRLSRLNVFIALGTISIVLIFLTTMLIAFTPLREYIPGYSSVSLTRKYYALQALTDSIERDLVIKDQYIQNIRNIIDGRVTGEAPPAVRDSTRRYSNVKLKKSVEDSLLRVEVESQSIYNLNRLDLRESSGPKKTSLGGLLFFVPLKGVITSTFNPVQKHFGIDIAAGENETVKSVLDGTVLSTNWTLETGYVIIVQHTGSVVSVYRHNAALLKKTGDLVRAGEPIAIIGNSGEMSTGVHLHFELWSDGNPVNPKDYISF